MNNIAGANITVCMWLPKLIPVIKTRSARREKFLFSSHQHNSLIRRTRKKVCREYTSAAAVWDQKTGINARVRAPTKEDKIEDVILRIIE